MTWPGSDGVRPATNNCRMCWRPPRIALNPASRHYQVNITRTERVGRHYQPEEEVLLSIRRNPKAVRLEWAKGPNKGREVIYSAAINDRMMYVNSGNSALPLPRMSIPVDSPLALRNSRHPITEAGFDTILDNLFKFLRADRGCPPATGNSSTRASIGPRGWTSPAIWSSGLHPREKPGKSTWIPRRSCPSWSTAVQTSSGELIERYSYRNSESESRRACRRRRLRSRQALGRIQRLAVTHRPRSRHAGRRQFPTNDDALTAKVTHKWAVVPTS